MDENPPIVPPPNPAAQPAAPNVLVCPQCHLTVPPGSYFCPNCGKKLNDPPLKTDVLTQAWIYAFSLILPAICYFAMSYWPAIKYFKSDDPKAQQIGMIAIGLLAL